MVLLIKNKHASFEDFVRLSDSPAGDVPKRRLASLSMQSLSNAGIPKAKSMPHIDLLADGGSLKAHCAAVLNVDLHKLKPRELIVRKVKSAKEDLRQLVDNAFPKQHVEPARGPSDSISMGPACSTTASNVGTSSSLDSSSSLAMSVPASLNKWDEDDEVHLHRLAAVAQSWLDSERLFSRRRVLSDQPIEEARHDFCHALIQSFSDRSSTTSPLQVPQSSDNLVGLPSIHPVSSPLLSSRALSATTLANQTTITLHPFESVVPKQPAQFPEFSDEELEREFNNFSFHSSQEEEWTSEVESRKQNATNRTFSDMKRELAVPVPKLSSYFSDDSLADSAAHRTLVNPRRSRSHGHSQEADDGSLYSADQEDEAEKDYKSVPALVPDSPDSNGTLDTGTTVFPACPVDWLPSSLMDDPTSDEKQDRVHSGAVDATADVWEALATHVPTLLTSISEECLADEYEIEATSQHPPPSFRRAVSQYSKFSPFRCQATSHLDHTDQVYSTFVAPLTEGTWSSDASSNSRTSLAKPVDDPISLSVPNPERILRRVRKFANLKNPIILPTVQSTPSLETIYETISLHEEVGFPEPHARRLRRVPGCLDLRTAFGAIDISIETPPSLSRIGGHSLQRSRREQYDLSDLEQGCQIQPASHCHVPTREESAKPPIPPKPPRFHLHRKKVQLSSALLIKEPSPQCSRCDPSSSLPLWSCAKITRSKAKRDRAPIESTRALKKRLDSIRIDPETIHGHPPQRCREEISFSSSISKSRNTKTPKTIKNLIKFNNRMHSWCETLKIRKSPKIRTPYFSCDH